MNISHFRKHLISGLLAFGLSFAAFSFPKDGVYSYDFDRIVDCVEVTAMYQSYGMEAWQEIQKKSWGNAVLIQDGSFVEPETGILLKVSATGKVTSPDNPTIGGKLKNNGDFFFQGYYEENNQILKIAISGKLIFSANGDRASKAYDGDFVMTDNGTGRKQLVKIQDGLYIWEYEDRQEDDFETWPVIVSPEGKINCGYEMTVRSGVKGLSEMVTSSTNKSVGNVTKNGVIQVQTLTSNSGSGQSVASDTITFSGVRGTENLNKITKDGTEVDIKQKISKSKNKNQMQKKDNPPAWYSDFMDDDDNYYYGTARKTHADMNTALKIAELTAASQIKMNLSQNVKVYSEGKQTMSKEIGGGQNGQNGQSEQTKIDSQFFSAVDSYSQIKIPYTIKNSCYDEKTQTAYVLLCLPKGGEY